MTKPQPLQTFIIYAREDFAHKQQLVLHLRPLIQNRAIKLWHDGNILPGEEWEKKIFEALSTSDLVLMLVSKSSLNSDFIQQKELKAALAQRERGQTTLVPIIVGHCTWQMDKILSGLQAIPDKKGRILPVTDTEWQNTDEAWTVVCKEIAQLLEAPKEDQIKAIETAANKTKKQQHKSVKDTSNHNTALKKFFTLSTLLLCLIIGVFSTIKIMAPKANKTPDKEIMAQHQPTIINQEKQKKEDAKATEKTPDKQEPSKELAMQSKDGAAKTKASKQHPSKIPNQTQQDAFKNNNPTKTQPQSSAPNALTLSARINEGSQNVSFATGETIELFTQVNKPCTLRILYMLADGQMILVEKDRIVNSTEINQQIEIGDGYEVAAPYGKETFIILASTKDFPTLNTIEEDGYTKIIEPTKTLQKIRGIKPKVYFQQTSIHIETKE